LALVASRIGLNRDADGLGLAADREAVCTSKK
jgi:hypothetical protein